MKLAIPAVIAALALTAPAQAEVKTVVLVHGAFADGAGWKPVAEILERDGYTVRVVQEPETSLADDAAATKRVLDSVGPCVLVGHSYGGAVITEAGNHPQVRSLVYLAAWLPDVGDSVASLNDRNPAATKAIEPAGEGYVAVNIKAFPADFAADAPPAAVKFMAISQVPLSIASFSAKATTAAWKSKPSYYLVAKHDRMINPDNERAMAKHAGAQTEELASSHAIYLAHPKEVAAFIEKAAKASK